MKKYIYTTILATFLFTNGLIINAQNINIHFKDGSSSSFVIENIQKQTFETETMKFHLKNGNIYSWSIASINSISYSTPLKIYENDSDENFIKIQLYPVPTDNIINIFYKLNNDEDITIIIFDMLGKIIFIEHIGKKSSGENNFSLDVSRFSKGLYTCYLKGISNSVVTKFIKN